MSIVTESIDHLTHGIAPKLIPHTEGMFQVRLLGLNRYHADIAIVLVDDKNNVLKYFGRGPIKVGDAANVDGLSSVWSEPGSAPISAYFQAWVMGINQEHTECEIGIRLVDDNRNCIKHIGQLTKKVGENLTFEGMKIKLNVIPKRLMQ